MSRLVALAYGALVYLFFGAVFLWAVGFVAGVPGIKSIDSGVPGDPFAAAALDLALLTLFAMPHSVMARQGFKR